jgi:hypothetical protein
VYRSASPAACYPHHSYLLSPAPSPTQSWRRHLRRLLVELLEVAKASKGKQGFDLDLSPVGEDFDPLAIA